jgi:hypothetical protein
MQVPEILYPDIAGADGLRDGCWSAFAYNLLDDPWDCY